MARSPNHHGPAKTASDLRRRDRWLRSLQRFLAGDRSGAAAVEFALVIVPLLMFVLAILQVAFYHFTVQSLDDATRMASRRIMIGEVQIKGLTAAKFKTDILCPALTFAIPCSKITVSFSPVARTSNSSLKTGIYAFIRPDIPDLIAANLTGDSGNFCSAGPGTFMFIDVAYNYLGLAELTKNVFPGSWASNPLILRSTNFVSNEPFPDSPAAGC